MPSCASVVQLCTVTRGSQFYWETNRQKIRASASKSWGGDKNPTLGLCECHNSDTTVLGTVPLVPAFRITLALGGFSGHCFSLPCKARLMGKNIPDAASCHPCVLCFVATLACSFKIHVRHLDFAGMVVKATENCGKNYISRGKFILS